MISYRTAQYYSTSLLNVAPKATISDTFSIVFFSYTILFYRILFGLLPMRLNKWKYPIQSHRYYYIIAIAKGYSFIQLYQDTGEDVHVYG